MRQLPISMAMFNSKLLVITRKSMENQHVSWENPWKITIFHGKIHGKSPCLSDIRFFRIPTPPNKAADEFNPNQDTLRQVRRGGPTVGDGDVWCTVKVWPLF